MLQDESNHSSCELIVRGLRENPSAVDGVIDDLSDCRRIRVHVHLRTRAQVTDYSLCRDLERVIGQLRESTCLDMVDLQDSLLQGYLFCCWH